MTTEDDELLKSSRFLTFFLLPSHVIGHWVVFFGTCVNPENKSKQKAFYKVQHFMTVELQFQDSRYFTFYFMTKLFNEMQLQYPCASDINNKVHWNKTFILFWCNGWNEKSHTLRMNTLWCYGSYTFASSHLLWLQWVLSLYIYIYKIYIYLYI